MTTDDDDDNDNGDDVDDDDDTVYQSYFISYESATNKEPMMNQIILMLCVL